MKPGAWKTERTGKFQGISVSGWRYADIAIWHVTVLPQRAGMRKPTYVVAAGEFHPNTAEPAEKVAVTELIRQWEAERLDAPTVNRVEMTIPSVLEDMSRYLPPYRGEPDRLNQSSGSAGLATPPLK